MDFLKIRKKAKDHARSGGSPPSPAAPAEAVSGPVAEATPAPLPERPPAPAAIEPTPAGSAAAPEVPPEPDPEARAADPRFTTWRPGAGMRPFVEVTDPAAVPVAFVDPRPPDPTRLRRIAPEAPRAHEAPAAPPVPVAVPTPAPPVPPVPRRVAGPRDPLDEFFYREDEQVPALAALPVDPEPAEAPGAEDEGLEEYLTFRLGVEEYAVAIERVREVLKSQPITEVPRAPAGILGVVTVRGEVVAVFDPRRRLGLPGAPPAEGTGRIVIVDDGGGPCGLLVDGVASVVRLARGSIEPCPQGIGGASADCLAGIGRERSRLFTVLDLGALLRPASARAGRTAHAGT